MPGVGRCFFRLVSRTLRRRYYELYFGTTGSLIAVVVGDVMKTVLPGTKVSQSQLRSQLERFETFRASLSSRDRSVVGILRSVWGAA